MGCRGELLLASSATASPYMLYHQPTKHKVTTIETIHPTTLMWYWSTILGKFAATAPPFDNVDPCTAPGNGWIDVRDVAHAHTLGLVTPAAGDQRIILVKDDFVWQDVREYSESLSSRVMDISSRENL